MTEGTVTSDGQGRAGLLVSCTLMQVFQVSPPQSALQEEQGRLWWC